MAKPRQILSKREKKLIVALYKEGKTDQQVADVIDLHRETFRRALKNSGLMSTIKKVKEAPDQEVERSMYKRACGFEYTEAAREEGPDGVKTKVTKKMVAPDTSAGIFWLCNRQPKRWKNTNRTEISGLGKDGAITFEDSTRFRDELITALARAVKAGVGRKPQGQPDGKPGPGVTP